MKEKLMEGR